LTSPNPVLPGWHPDPSICRVDNSFYLVTSTFAFYPGLPIYRSSDLHHWDLIGHALIDESWPSLGPVDVSDGIWAATIRHADGVFYIVFTVAAGRTGAGLYVTTATRPEGPWSSPRQLDGDGIDPSLFFDDDGKVFLTAARDATSPHASGPGEIWMRQFDPSAGALIGPTFILWHGAATGTWVEAPHLYKRDGTYHLICAEGGTERNHAVTAARATEITGPYRTDPRSPLLTHRHLGDHATVQNVGHADIVDGSDGRSWAVVLGVRPIDGHHTLGRETFVVPVQWSRTGPVFAPGEGRIVEGAAPAGRARSSEDWISLRGPVEAEVAEQRIVLTPRPAPLDSAESPAFLGVRQDHHMGSFEAGIDTDEIIAHEAGLAALQGSGARLTVSLVRRDTGVVLRATHAQQSGSTLLGELAVSGHVRVGIRMTETHYAVTAATSDRHDVVARLPRTSLSTETAGGFVGVTLGIFNIAAGDASQIAFHTVRYCRGTEGANSQSGLAHPMASLA
jgi:alpha-N-arabinofuranosidase